MMNSQIFGNYRNNRLIDKVYDGLVHIGRTLQENCCCYQELMDVDCFISKHEEKPTLCFQSITLDSAVTATH